ncbi:MAG: hypothetical protein M3463_16005 [Verrucomicrobiota bacterium]|nr:hypothetical protein [Verrucomicrobiota bacterium]
MLHISRRSKIDHPEARRALSAADGYLYLGMAEEALAELNEISPAKQQAPAVLLARIRVLLHLRKYEQAEKLSRGGTAAHPEEEEFTVQRAFALHKLQKSDEAVEVISAAPEWIRRTGILHYNLACYEARLGDLAVARQCIDAAIQLNAAIKRNARVDPDLQALWN